jgi:hypothetical protein
MKNPTLLVVALISAFASMAQQQPFIQYGYKVKVTTLSNGKYVEYFDQDTIVQIGTVLLNRRSGKIVSFVAYDTTLGEYSLKPELISRWMSPDPLAHEFSSESPYNFGFNNPVRFVDPDGRAPWDIIIQGSEKQTAFNELQASVQGQLNLSMDASGKVTYTQVGEGKLSKDAQQLTNAINNSSIVINVTAENTTTTQSGNLYIGGAFGGNIVTKGEGANRVDAKQEVNPGVLNKMSTAHGKPGADMLHEVTEAYQGGLISQKKGISSPVSNQDGSVYPNAHLRATKQSGNIYERIYDAFGKEMKMNTDGSYPTGVKRADWYVIDKKSNKVVIQELK